MNKVLNEYIDNGDDTHLLRIVSKNYPPYAATVDDRFLVELRKWSWCYEQTKGEVYTMDFTGKITGIFNFKTARVYLWRYVCYLHTKNHKLVVRRNLRDDYTMKDVTFGVSLQTP